MSVEPTPVPPPSAGGAVLDHHLLGVYLNDHLAGAVGGAQRMRRTADALARTPVGPDLDRVATEVAQEREELRALIETMGFVQARPKQLATWLGERLARLVSNGRMLRHSPLTDLLEVEILRSAVTGKLGLWQTLVDLGPQLSADPGLAALPARWQQLVDQSLAQVATLDRVHEVVRVRALRASPTR